ncbi:hypothetical protein [Candidatus Dormiibacter inghamiae]
MRLLSQVERPNEGTGSTESGGVSGFGCGSSPLGLLGFMKSST